MSTKTITITKTETNIINVLESFNVKDDIIVLRKTGFTELVLFTTTEYTVLYETDYNRSHVIGSTCVFDRMLSNFMSGNFVEDSYLNVITEERKKLLYLDYNTGCFLKETSAGIQLVINAI